jgi:hypothetical protein
LPDAKPAYKVSKEDRALLDQRIKEAESYVSLLTMVRDGKTQPVRMSVWTRSWIRTPWAYDEGDA